MKKIIFFAAICVMLLASCSQDEAMITDITSADITFCFEIPGDFYRYYEITAIHNNAAITDVEVEQVFDREEYAYTCRIKNVPGAVPLQLQFRRTNRPIPSDANLTITAKEKVTVHKYGDDTELSSETMYFSPKYQMGTSVQNFAVRVSSDGVAQFIIKD